VLLEGELGVERFYYFLADYPDEMVETMELMHAKNLEACRIVAESPAEVVIIYENTSTSYMTPHMFTRYVVRHLNDYADMYHAAGKLVLIHMCGKLKNAAQEIRQGRYDGICDIAPPPTGDVELAEASRLWGDRLSVWGGIDATSLTTLSPQHMKEHVRHILGHLTNPRGVILGSGDAVPLGTPLETLRAITEVVKEIRLS
jgi:uroporphyrinogen-III decarboxylase